MKEQVIGLVAYGIFLVLIFIGAFVLRHNTEMLLKLNIAVFIVVLVIYIKFIRKILP